MIIMVRLFSRFMFIGGFFIGLALAVLILLINNKPSELRELENQHLVGHYGIWFYVKNFKRLNVSLDELRYTKHKYLLESNLLYDKIKIVCVILVYRANYTKAAEATWAKYCNNISTITTTKSIPGVRNRKGAMWLTMCKHLQNLPVIYNWILIIRDDTFAILENIRYIVAPLNSTKPYYLGHAIKFWGVTYNLGQAGYLLSNATLTSLKNIACQSDFKLQTFEDYYLGKTLHTLNITPSDTRDSFGLSTFHGFNLQKLFYPGGTLLSNYYKLSTYPVKCCSYNSVTFKVSSIDQMFMYEYLLYKLQIFNSGHYGNRAPTTPFPEQEVWRSFLRKLGISVADVDAEEYNKLWEDVMSNSSFLSHSVES